MQNDPIAEVLDHLMMFDDILACMVARRNMISVEPSGGTNSFKPEIFDIWDEIKRVIEGVFMVITETRGIVGKVDIEIYQYNALLYVLPETDTAVVAIVPSLSNKGLIDVEMERARQKIQKIRESTETTSKAA